MKYLIEYFHFFALMAKSAALRSTIKHTIPPEIAEKCLSTRLPLHTLTQAGYSVKLIYLDLLHCFFFQGIAMSIGLNRLPQQVI